MKSLNGEIYTLLLANFSIYLHLVYSTKDLLFNDMQSIPGSDMHASVRLIRCPFFSPMAQVQSY